jgi:hypothetical protein
MVSFLETAVRKWRELGLVGNNRQTGEMHREQENEKTQKQRRKKREREITYINGTKITRFQQTTISGENLEEKDNESFGDSMPTKEENIFRIGSQNIRLLPEAATVDHSNAEADVFLMSEVSLLAKADNSMVGSVAPTTSTTTPSSVSSASQSKDSRVGVDG